MGYNIWFKEISFGVVAGFVFAFGLGRFGFETYQGGKYRTYVYMVLAAPRKTIMGEHTQNMEQWDLIFSSNMVVARWGSVCGSS